METTGKKLYPHFKILSPRHDVEDPSVFEALDFVFDNTKQIHNVAIAGPYGAGKSSLLYSYLEKPEKKNIKDRTLNISLASFCADESHTSENKIEESILQQIFFKKAAWKFPKSHFRRLNYRWLPFFAGALVVVAVILLFSLVLLEGDAWSDISDFLFRRNGNGLGYSILAWAALLCSLTGLAFLVSQAMKLSVSKISMKNVELEANSEDGSLLNKYVDELIYFFVKTKYEYVVIEDIDRFENSSLFAKLREMNTILNEYDGLKNRNIVFFYLLKDDFFSESLRVKFFDFIIPIIPVIDTSNSTDFLTRYTDLNESYFNEVPKEFLWSTSLYISEPRVLLNSLNEFLIYYHTLSEEQHFNLVTEKLFALMLYKNLCPKDYALFLQRDGNLYTCLTRRKAIISRVEAEKTGDKKRLEQELADLIAEEQKKIDDVRVSVVKEICKLYKLPEPDHFERFLRNGYFDSVVVGQGILVLQESDFVMDDKLAYFYDNPKPIHFDFNDDIPFSAEYHDSMIELYDEYFPKKANLKEKIQEIMDWIFDFKKKSLKDLASDTEYAEEVFAGADDTCENVGYLRFVIAGGYVDEDFERYTSHFYEGTFCWQDKFFLQNIKSAMRPDFSLALTEPKKIISYIQEYEWARPSVLNYDLLRAVFDGDDPYIKKEYCKTILQHEEKSNEKFFATLSEHFSDDDVRSVYEELYKNLHEEKNWADILFSHSQNEQIYQFLLWVDVDEPDGWYKDFVERHVAVFYGKPLERRVEDKLKKYKIQFALDDSILGERALLNTILHDKLYRFSPENFTVILKSTGQKLTDPIYNFYNEILVSNLKDVRMFVNSRIDIFVKDVLLPLGKRLCEPSDGFEELLVRSNLSDENAIELINNNQYPVYSLKKLCDAGKKTLCKELLEKNKVVSSVTNMVDYYKCMGESSIPDIREFLLMANNSEKLFENIHNAADSQEDYAIMKKIMATIYESNDLDDSEKEKTKKILDVLSNSGGN